MIRRWLVLSVGLLAAPAQADDHVTPLHAFLPSAHARAEEQARTLERELTQTLALLPRVAHARVHVSLPSDDTAPLDEAPESPQVQVALHVSARGIREQEVAAMVRRPLPLRHARVDVQLVSVASPALPALVDIGPFRVHPQSATTLRVILTASLCANVLLALLVLTRRSRGQQG